MPVSKDGLFFFLLVCTGMDFLSGFMGTQFACGCYRSRLSPWSLPLEEVSSGFKTGVGILVFVVSASGGPGSGPLAVRGGDCGTGAALKGSLSWLDVVEPVFCSSVPGLRAQ